jgi:uncharacterized membrane protein
MSRPVCSISNSSLDDLLLLIFGPIHHYGGADARVLVALMNAFKNLLYQPLRPQQKIDLLRHVHSALETADQQLSNSREREAVNQLIERINQTSDCQHPIALLAISDGTVIRKNN